MNGQTNQPLSLEPTAPPEELPPTGQQAEAPDEGVIKASGQLTLPVNASSGHPLIGTEYPGCYDAEDDDPFNRQRG